MHGKELGSMAFPPWTLHLLRGPPIREWEESEKLQLLSTSYDDPRKICAVGPQEMRRPVTAIPRL